MITKETARQIYNCHQQIEEIGKIKSEMCEEVKKARERAAKEPCPIAEGESTFGKYGKGMQLGVPNGICSSMRIFNISPEIAIQVMDEQVEVLKKRLRELNVIAKIELEANDDGKRTKTNEV